MEKLIVVVLWYPLFGIPALVGGFISWVFFRKKVKLIALDWLMLVLPWVTWISLLIIDGFDKTLSNAIEAVVLGSIAFILLAIRLAAEVYDVKKRRVWSKWALIVCCISAVVLWWLVPGFFS